MMAAHDLHTHRRYSCYTAAVLLRSPTGATVSLSPPSWTAQRWITSPVVIAPILALALHTKVFDRPRSRPSNPLTITGAAATISFPEIARTISGFAATKLLAKNTITIEGYSTRKARNGIPLSVTSVWALDGRSRSILIAVRIIGAPVRHTFETDAGIMCSSIAEFRNP